MRKEVSRDSAATKTPRAAVKPSSPGKGQKRAAPSDKPEVKKKKPVKPAEGDKSGGQSPSAEKKKKLLKPKVVLTKLNPGSVPQLAKTKPVKEAKKETSPKPVKQKPKKVVVSKATKKDIKLENDSKRAKIVRAVKDVKKARSVVASKMAKISPKKLSDGGTVRKISGGKINVVKQHNIVKRVNKMSGKKPCVVSVKISNAHSTVTLSVKQNKQVGKKDSMKCSKSGGGKGNDRSTISIVKKGIASRRKSTSKECTSQESTPSQSPTRDTSPIRCKDGKSLKVKKSENIKTQKKITKQSSVESKKGSEDRIKDKQSESQSKESTDGKTEVIINETVKIKTENVGEDQNMEIEFTTSADKDLKGEKGSKSCDSNVGSDIGNKSRSEMSLHDSKVKSPLNDYNNLKSVDSSTSDEIPLDVLKFKQRHIKQEKDSDETSQGSVAPKKSKEGKESPRQEAVDNIPLSQRDDDSSNSNSVPDKKKNETEKQTKPNPTKKISKASLKKMDQESAAKLKISSKTKEKLKDLALKKQKAAKLVKNSKLSKEKQRKEQEIADKGKEEPKGRRRMKLLKFWNGPKRHRVASLNAIAKVHCLYENESRGALNDVISSAAALQRAIQESKKLAKQLEMSRGKDKEKEKEKKPNLKKSAQLRKKSPEPVSTRNLRTNPGVRSVGRNFDILNVISSTSLSSSSSEESSDSGEEKKQLVLPLSVKQKQLQIKKEESEQTTDDESSKKTPPSQDDDSKDGVKKVKKRRRKRNELTMDLKDMVVRKRMASLNASAIMTASYSTEKKSREEKKKEEDFKKERKKKKKAKEPEATPEAEESSGDEDLIVRTTNNKQKVAVIVNQDTDVTITGVYVNSTTRSTHHEGYCSIAGMQYRISSTSHTQTEATAVATETVLHAEHPACLPEGGSAQTVVTTALAASPCKSYTPLSALSSMQPPGHPHGHPPGPPCQGPRGPPLSPLQRRHGCSSAFSAPPNYPPPPPGQPHPPGPPPHPDVHGYYQPAGPLISTHHHHHHSSTSVTSKLPPPPTPPPSSAPHPPSESSDTEVVPADNPPPGYRYPAPAGQYNYGYQYYPSPPASSLQYPGQSHYHQEICYSPSGYPPGYFPKGHYPHAPGYRRYGHQYYPPQDFYPNPPPQTSNPPPSSNNQMIVTAPPSGGQTSSSFPPSEGNYPPPAPIVDPYPPPPPPQSYYPGYSAGPPPPCYSTHSPSSRGLFIDAAYQGCPCPMQSCPKNVHTGPLTGASKGSIKNQTTPLPPVALALPLEPPGALGPPSPARGSAGMPPPPSPALATARNPPQSPPTKPTVEQTGLLTIGKMVTDAVLLADHVDAGLPLADFVPKSEPIKLEVEDIVKIEATEEIKCNRKRRKSLKDMNEVKRQALEAMMTEVDIKVQPEITELPERLIVKEEPEKEKTIDKEKPVDKLPLSDNGATVPVKTASVPVLNGHVKSHPKKRKLVSSDSEPAAKIAKCVNKVLKKKCAKSKKVAENIAPEGEPVTEEPAKVVCRRNSKPVERRKSSCSPHNNATAIALGPRDVPAQDESQGEAEEASKKKKVVRGKKVQEKTKADHLLRSHGKTEAPAPVKERRLSKSGSSKSDISPVRGPKKLVAPAPPPVDPSADSPVCLPGLRKSLTPKWSNGWSWEGTPYKAKIFLNIDDGAVVRKCYPAMRHAQGDVIMPRDCILLKSGPRKIDLPFVAKVAAMWENPDDGEMMVSLLWYYRPEHTEQGRRSDDIPDEIFASRHKDTNSVACIEDKCFVLTFNEYCRYRRAVRVQEEGLTAGSGPRLVPPPEGGCYPRLHRQPPGRVAPDLVFFCRRVYDFRQKRILKNPC